MRSDRENHWERVVREIKKIHRSGSRKEQFCFFMSTTFYSGMLGENGKGGGTYGALVALLLLLPLLAMSVSGEAILWVATLSLILGFWFAKHGEAVMRLHGARPRHTGVMVEEDFNETNWDEFHGMFVSVLPLFYLAPRLEEVGIGLWWQELLLVSAFGLFRLFDVQKWWPVRQTERLFHGPAGVMLDDAVAGVQAALVIGLICMGLYIFI